MQHKIKYSLKGESLVYLSSLSLEGENSVQTAMSKTVGLPLAMTVKQFIINKLPQKGIVLPIYPEIYEPVLEELSSYGISFQEEILSEAIAEGKPE
jgi:hypothetical protein